MIISNTTPISNFLHLNRIDILQHMFKQILKNAVKRFKMGKYEMIIYWSEEDNSFIVEIPELPGCMADGQTYQEAVSNAEIIIKEWIETAKEMDRDIPKPKGKLMYA
ncbi:Toxin-antitoxin system, antitoxin component, HicB-like [Desulfonema limicola]|uniref:Toxin-antitoxin system, antitoxin component, HicB-like n=1 Tax=Desulfonema limicola TaxID=45656 RepID=A0A975GHR1_9BACT|nr:type II toxin-antitoxin system HicB family antitoxin [Desulfonema limicola]QTA81614.1 Toxin-antitoxin system, antitoxin component, HicB-like [Desulfonema limicola]